jgi:hypothetical protein
MASARIGELQTELTTARQEVKLELKKAPVDYTKIGVYERQIADLRDELKMYNLTAGELLQ